MGPTCRSGRRCGTPSWHSCRSWGIPTLAHAVHEEPVVVAPQAVAPSIPKMSRGARQVSLPRSAAGPGGGAWPCPRRRAAGRGPPHGGVLRDDGWPPP
eukprot:8178796-Pyramimonas_sp.AAC.1